MNIKISIFILLFPTVLFTRLPYTSDATTGSTKLYKTDSLHKYINIFKVTK